MPSADTWSRKQRPLPRSTFILLPRIIFDSSSGERAVPCRSHAVVAFGGCQPKMPLQLSVSPAECQIAVFAYYGMSMQDQGFQLHAGCQPQPSTGAEESTSVIMRTGSAALRPWLARAEVKSPKGLQAAMSP